MANDGFIEFLSPNALAELKKASEIVDALALKIEKISNFKAPTTPGGVNNASKQIIDDLKAQETQLKAINAELIREEKLKQQVLATETKQSNATKANIAQREAQRKASLAQQQSDEKTTRATERSALANQRLNDAYGQLNKRRNESARTLQNLIASETASNAEIRKAQREFDILNGKVKKADQAVGNFSRNVGNYKSALSGVSQLMSAFGISTGLFLAVDIAKSIFNTTKQLQSLDMALRNVSGTQLIYQENMNFLSKVSEDFGIEIKGLQEQFTQFYVAAKDKLSADQIRDIFKSISKAGAAMGLSVDAQKSAFLALQQMMSKGTVQAEELKKQLGNALPGAFNIMATALGVTEKKMMEMMKAGNILSEVALPKFAKALEKAYGIENVERIDTIIAAQERLANSWTNLIRTTTEGNGFIVNILIKTLDLWTLSLNGVIYATNVLSQATKNLFGIEDNNTTKRAKAVKQAISDYEEMQSALKKANEERDKEIFRLNRLEKIEEKLTGSAKTRAQEVIVLSKEKLKLLDANIEKESKLLDIDKVDTVKKLNDEIVALKARNAEVSLFSLQAIEKRDKLTPQSEEWLDLNKYVNDNNKIVEENNRKLTYNYNLRELILRKDKVRTPPELDTETGTSGNKRQRERIRLNYEEAESLYNLRIARLKELQVLQKEITDNQDAPDYTRLEARKEFSRLAVEILDEQYKKEKALSNLKYKEDLDKANEIYLKNKKNGFDDVQNNEEWAKAIKDINDRYNNETELANINHSKAWKTLMYEDADFNEKIRKVTFDKEEKLRKQTIEDINALNDAINKSEQEKNLNISNNERLTLKTRQTAFQEYQHQALLQLQIDKQRETTGKETAIQLDLLNLKYKNLAEAITNLETPLDVAHEKTLVFLRDSNLETINKGLEDLGVPSLQMFLDLDQNGQSTFDKLLEGAENFQEQFAVTFQAVGDIAQDVFNKIAEASNKRFQDEYARLEKEKEVALVFAGESVSGQEEIQKQYEEKKRQIANREAQAKKKQAIFNIAIDTAQAIVASLKTDPTGLLAIGIGLLGLAQIGIVQSQEVPQFFKGTDNAPEGMAWTQEKGREIITDKYGKIKSTGSDKGAQLTYLSKGDKVFTAEKSALMFNENLNSILTNNGISGAKVEVNTSGISDEQINRIVSSINNKESVQIYNDGTNIITKRKRANELVEIANKRINFVSKSV